VVELGVTTTRVTFIGVSKNHEIWNLIGIRLRNIRAEAEILASPRKKSLALIGVREILEVSASPNRQIIATNCLR
jgi:hypothetical protein